MLKGKNELRLSHESMMEMCQSFVNTKSFFGQSVFNFWYDSDTAKFVIELVPPKVEKAQSSKP